MKYDNQFFIDFVDAMPEDQKRCRVNTLEDGTGSVDLGDFIVNYGSALVKHIQENDSKPKRKPRTKAVSGK